MNNKSLFIIKPIEYNKFLYQHRIKKFMNKKNYKLNFIYGNLLNINLDLFNFKKINTLDPNIWYPIENYDNSTLLIINKYLTDYSFLFDLLEFNFSIDIIFILDKFNIDNLIFLKSDLFNWSKIVDLEIKKLEEIIEFENLLDFIYE